MAAIVNDRDMLIMAAVPRFTVGNTSGMFLTPPAAVFKTSASGLTATPSSFVFKATLLNLVGTVTFTWTGGLSFVVNGNEATLNYASGMAASGTLTASITVDGVLYSQTSTVTTLADGLPGTPGTPGLNSPPQTAAQLVDTLRGQITQDLFAAGLQSTIGLIDAPATTPGSVAARVKAETDARAQAISTEVMDRGAAINTAIAAEVGARNTAIVNYGYTKEASDQSLAQQATAITAAYKTYTDGKTGQALTDAKAFVTNYGYSFADANAAIAQSASSLQANINSAVSTARAYTETWGYSKAQIDSSEAAQFNALTTNYKGYADGVGQAATSTANADVRSYTMSTAGINGAISSASTALTSSFQGADASNLAAAKTYADSAITNYTYSKSDITGAIATSTSTVTARLNGIGGPGVTIEQVFTAQANTLTGLSGQWAIKLNAAGQVAGIGLASSSATGTPTSIFTVVADKFALAYPGVNSKIPFIIGKVAGQSVIGLDGSVVIDGSLVIRAADGTVILGAGGLNAAYAAPGTKNNEIDLSWWKAGAAIPWQVNGEANAIYSSTNDFSLLGPKGGSEDIWSAYEATGDGGKGGGWEQVPISLDPTKTYRFMLPVLRRSGTGVAYWGCGGVATLNTAAADTVQYFASGQLPTVNRWHLMVGFIYPAGSTGHDNSGAGLIDCSTGQIISTDGEGKPVGLGNYNFLPGGGSITHRAYQYYANTGGQHLFGRPIINIVDGSEPSLREYLAAGAVLNTALVPSIAAAATTSTWGGVTGALKPEDSATRGATLGVNVGGKITEANAPSLVGPNAITNTMIGGDLLSANWNGDAGVAGVGWAASRSGNFYVNQLYARGALAGGNFTADYAWPANGGGGYHVSATGALWGNANNPALGFVQIQSNGELHMPGFDYAGRQLTLDGPVILRAKLGNGVSSSMSPTQTSYAWGNNFQYNNFFAGTFTISVVGMGARLRRTWRVSIESPFVTNAFISTAEGSNQGSLYVTGKLSSGYEIDIQVFCDVTDLDGLATTTSIAWANIQVQS